MVPFFSNADLPIAFDTLAWVQTFLVDPTPLMKRSRESTGESICPFAKPVLAENALYMAFHHEVNGKSADLIESIVAHLVRCSLQTRFDSLSLSVRQGWLIVC